MFVVDATAIVPAPPDLVFRLVGSLAAAPWWRAGVAAARGRGGRRLPHGQPADVAVLVYRALGARFDVVTRVAGCDPPGSVTYAGRADPGFDLTVALTLQAAEGGTRLRYRTELTVHAPGPLADRRAALCRLLGRRVPRDLDRLAVLLARA